MLRKSLAALQKHRRFLSSDIQGPQNLPFIFCSHWPVSGLGIALFQTARPCWAEDLQDLVTVIAMPQLSPHMKSGIISKWLKKPGDEVAIYDVIFEVSTDTLSEEAYKVGDFAGSVTMLVEVCCSPRLLSTSANVESESP